MTTTNITISIGNTLLKAVENERGDISRSKYISNILKKEVCNDQHP
jgi:metal-responsive CopG/Arc/MetJ family transcriptional regulator